VAPGTATPAESAAQTSTASVVATPLAVGIRTFVALYEAAEP